MKLLSLVIGIINLLLGPAQPVPSSSTNNPLPTIEEQQHVITVNQTSYEYTIIGPIDPNTVSLHSNLPDKKTSQELKNSFHCSNMVNGGFYGKDDKHIGLFLTEGIVRNEQINNALFNGFIAESSNGIPRIDAVLPDTDLTFALQTGPLLMENQTQKALKIRQDEPARRITVGLDIQEKLYFTAVYLPSNQYSGPLLAELPNILQQILQQENITLKDAINLDGGNHSAFYGENILTELSPIGSFFCIK